MQQKENIIAFVFNMFEPTVFQYISFSSEQIFWVENKIWQALIQNC